MGRIRKIGSAHLQLFTNLISAFVVYTKLETVSFFISVVKKGNFNRAPLGCFFKIYRYWYTDLLFEVKFYFVSEHLPDDSDKLAGTVPKCIVVRPGCSRNCRGRSTSRRASGRSLSITAGWWWRPASRQRQSGWGLSLIHISLHCRRRRESGAATRAGG